MNKHIFLLALLWASLQPLQAATADAHKDHAHAAPAAVLETNASVPAMHAQSEQFELVARLYDNELGLYIDDWVSNAPVLNAEVEVELNGIKARATFHADHGDYAVADPALLKALQAEGEHALIFTISTEKAADLLTGTLHVHAAAGAAAMVRSPASLLLFGAVGLMLLTGCGLAARHWYQARKGESA